MQPKTLSFPKTDQTKTCLGPQIIFKNIFVSGQVRSGQEIYFLMVFIPGNVTFLSKDFKDNLQGPW